MNTFIDIFDFVNVQMSWWYSFTSSDDETKQIKTYINQAHKSLLSLEPWRRNQEKYEFDSVLSQPEYSLPSDFLTSDYIRLEDWKLLNNLSVEDYITYTSVPIRTVWTINWTFNYTIFDDKIHLFPVPSEVLTFQLYYQKKYIDLVDDDDPILVLDGFQLLVAYKALFLLYMKREEANTATVYENMYDKLLVDYKKVVNKKTKSILLKNTWVTKSYPENTIQTDHQNSIVVVS